MKVFISQRSEHRIEFLGYIESYIGEKAHSIIHQQRKRHNGITESNLNLLHRN